MSARHLYLARHAEPDHHGSLTERGVQQAIALGHRLSQVPLGSVLHGPLPRATETARLVAGQLDHQLPLSELDAAGDYVPHLPSPDEVDPAFRSGVMAFLSEVSAEEAVVGAKHASEAIRLLTPPEQTEEDSHQLVVTHAFTIGWLVREVYGAAPWRWLGIDSCHAALTVIRCFADRPPAVAVFNDMSHLAPEHQWTGFPEHLRL
ncbi:histidine phosphatase family protein [Nocardioides lijunqiniae]|uniref:histidine phosphatase family protein n=1 Tax=Nocardioides lijunqiniae TaxID=2760832 RepID=UPI001D0CDAAA|nr:histidine phosphatase family protein [Nocardioides lijunqiniae]